LVIIDEVSNISAHMMGMIDSRLREIMDRPTIPFGGLSVIFFGDLSQLPPVKNKSIARSALELAKLDASHSKTSPASINMDIGIQEPAPKKQSGILAPDKERFKATHKILRKKISESNAKHKISQYGSYKAGSMLVKGAKIFSSLERYHLVDQKRTDDAEHLAFLTKMSRGMNITDTDLARYRKLSAGDMTKD
jgi:hypothetical protein